MEVETSCSQAHHRQHQGQSSGSEVFGHGARLYAGVIFVKCSNMGRAMPNAPFLAPSNQIIE